MLTSDLCYLQVDVVPRVDVVPWVDVVPRIDVVPRVDVVPWALPLGQYFLCNINDIALPLM